MGIERDSTTSSFAAQKMGHPAVQRYLGACRGTGVVTMRFKMPSNAAFAKGSIFLRVSLRGLSFRFDFMM